MLRVTVNSFSLALLAALTFAAQVAAPGQAPAQNAAPPATVASSALQPTHEQIADSLMAHQRYQAAIEEYKQTASAPAWNKRGIANQLMFNVAEAERCYREALRLDPKNAVYYNNLGSTFMAEKQFSKAEKSYRKALRLDPQSALFHKNMGTALLAERKYDRGWQEYQAALAIDSTIFEKKGASVRVENPASIQDRGAMNFYMAKGCVRAGMLERAIEYLRMALNEGFTNPKKILADAELASLRDVPQFQQLMASQGVYLTDPNMRPAALRQ